MRDKSLTPIYLTRNFIKVLMQSKQLLIAIAAFAVTATGVQAYGGVEMLERADLHKNQLEAVREAQGRRAKGDFIGAHDILLDAGIGEGELDALRKVKVSSRDSIQQALHDDDYEAFKKAVSDSPVADIVTSLVDFELFKKAHDLRQGGRLEGSRGFISGLGGSENSSKQHHHGDARKAYADLTDEQHEALVVARQANDKMVVRAILDESGVIQHLGH